MPLIKREVEPVLVSRVDIGSEIQNELECVTNYTLASIIRQLSNLGKHAEDIFGELYREAMFLSGRANTLQDRIDKLSDKVTKLDATRDQVSLQDIHMRKAFKSSLALETEVVSSPTMPSAMRETYMRCEKPPKLSLLNQFREDGKDGLKFYTDPKFFFERWCNEQRKDIENNIRKRKRRRQKKPAAEKGSMPKVPVNTRKNRYQMYAGGAEFAAQHQRPQQSITNSHISSNQVNQDPEKQRISHSDSIISSTPSDDSGINGQSQRRKPSQGPPPPPLSQGGESPMNGDVVLRPVRPAPGRPPSQQQLPQPPPMNHHVPTMPPPPPPNVPQPQSYLSSGTSGYSSSSDLPPPPPPPQPVMMNNHVPAQPPPPVLSQPLPNNIPAPPPPPPVGGPAAPPPPPIGGIQKPPVANNNVPAPPPPPPDQFRLPSVQPAPASNPNNTSPVVNSPNKPQPVQASDPRSDLLAAIQEGMKLRKVEVQEEKQRHSEPAPNSVEAILRRRIAVELSSDEEDSQVSSDYDGEWSDED